MSSKKKPSQPQARAAKRARFAEQKKSGGASPLVLIVGIAAVLALIGGTVFALTRSSSAGPEAVAIPSESGPTAFRTGDQGLLVKAATLGHEPYPLVEAQDGAVRLLLSTFDDYKAHHYTYMHEGRPIEFFVLRSKDGVVRAAFNACDVCFQSKLGYTQEGDYMVCKNCGRRFPADQINVVHGGCNPSPLTRTVEGDHLVIQVQDIVRGLDYF
jgi:hypothetical protein